LQKKSFKKKGTIKNALHQENIHTESTKRTRWGKNVEGPRVIDTQRRKPPKFTQRSLRAKKNGFCTRWERACESHRSRARMGAERAKPLRE